ncbi:Uma2 family endonuclease [Gloeothece verrucosa]|uniref:Putative restriction endonuclease domain-containing protein n=1 Tax=Gloeothece verrucosa (strain PCC 7822) TaxID=497965 RepID=E0UBY4_GLOV7|nr:Uma2 family endonuclease [Gloeothece verrucosa]ADN15199.1 protein of unknown function DUF820 [Gloeothece verrucosa PCC 7822]
MMNPLPVYIPPTFKVTDEQFREIAAANRDLRLEKTATGELIVMPPTGGNTGRRNSDLGYQVYAWNKQANLGVVFDSSTAFVLPNGAIRSPDVAWIEREKWDSLTSEQQNEFPPLCPDFVIELRSKSDSLKDLREKMLEYLDNGAKLGWLIDPQNKQVEIYRPLQEVKIFNAPKSLTGEDILPGFVLDLTAIFS